MAYWRQSGHTKTKVPLELQNYPVFCDIIKDLPRENFEIGYHGLWHGVPPHNNNDEFKEVGHQLADKKIKAMFLIQKLAGLDGVFKPIFRPPAWKMSPEAFEACKDNGIRIFAISEKEGHKKIYDGADRDYDCVYSIFPFNFIPDKPLQLFNKTEIVYHACEWDRNYLDKEKADELINFLTTHRDNIKYSFMNEMI